MSTCSMVSASEGTSDGSLPDSVKTRRNGLIGWAMDYLDEAYNKPVSQQPKFDLIGAPYYSSDSKFGLGIMASSLYRTNPDDSTTRPSYSSLTFKATTASHFELTLEGEHIPYSASSRFTYLVDFTSINTKYWGIGYSQCNNDANESQLKYMACHTELIWAKVLGPSFFVGPMLTFDMANALNFSAPELWADVPLTTVNYGAGISLRYDTRDNTTAANRGVYLRLLTSFNPAFIGNKHPFSVNELTACRYIPAWNGAVVAGRMHWRITWGNTPWGALSYLGGPEVMRGYFEGRYRDKCAADVCLELRQHIYGRSGVVAWVGAGSIFPKVQDIRTREILPNYGFGYRWAFQKNVNVRVDFGFGKNESGLFFNVNEAF